MTPCRFEEMRDMNLRELAHILGGEVHGREVLCPGPGHSRSDRSLSVRIEPDARRGFVVNSFAGDDWRVCRAYVLSRMGLSGADLSSRQREPVPRSGAEQHRRLALRIWRESGDPHGTIVESYLANRGLVLDPEASRSICFHPHCPLLDADGARYFGPAMVCAMREVKGMIDDAGEPHDDDNRITAIHRTALTPRGRGRRMMLGPTAGSAIFLDDPMSILERGEVVLSEGVETALSMREFGYGPNLALGSTAGFLNFPDLTPMAMVIRISAENDSASRVAVENFTRRANAAGQYVFIMRPRRGANDANDLLMMEARDASA
jgi:hypothetical protein